jgi:SDR family mycofactocin-dependent oxidoreductase
MPRYDFSDKVALVTGAAHGQGRSHAAHYARHGADVVVTDIGSGVAESVPYDLGTSEELDETAELVEDEGQEALALEMDVRDEAAVESAVAEAIDHFGKIDVLANNAAVITISEMVQLDEREWDDVVETNLKGVWLCSKHVGQHFIERGDGGKIVSTASQAGVTGDPGAGHYVATKHGVLGLTKTLALELAEYDVNVNAVYPSVVETPMIAGLAEAYGEELIGEMSEVGGPMNVFDHEDPAIDSKHISEAYMWLSSEAARYVTGIALPVDTGHTAK